MAFLELEIIKIKMSPNIVAIYVAVHGAHTRFGPVDFMFIRQAKTP